MYALLALLGLGAAFALVAGIGGDDDAVDETPEQEEMPPVVSLQTFTDGDDAVLDQRYVEDARANADDLVAEGELTRAEADAALDAIRIAQNPANLDTGAGDDYVVTGDGADTVRAGAGDDVVVGGGGNDLVSLGDGDDVYGSDVRTISLPDDVIGFPDSGFGIFGTDAALEGGDDTIMGGAGMDAISDSFGRNVVFGNQGQDFIVTVDEDGPGASPDTVDGGFGNDTLVVDQGDVVTGNQGRDLVTVDLFAGVSDDYAEITITDFQPGIDTLELEGSFGLLMPPSPTGPDDVPVNPISVADLADGTAAIVSVNGIPVVRVMGGAGMTVADVRISV
ncbi:hypothetical protein FIU94_07625 [Sulfitobacter sp. THAF37]|uniref:calcium-binding protein n=1 Tax=Sulfitobacter sp. THAF37 TaxID=2587855 RepID=UPI0012686D43|nr:hypothetical protein [Sulfitobacter sp. THAF37]QFT58692.1 hypothetical protein FIU94_07625 [Sulfitobacter sp. THAF37]